jgi:hypothetical protein
MMQMQVETLANMSEEERKNYFRMWQVKDDDASETSELDHKSARSLSDRSAGSKRYRNEVSRGRRHGKINDRGVQQLQIDKGVRSALNYVPLAD